jgi:hypothetical protein
VTILASLPNALSNAEKHDNVLLTHRKKMQAYSYLFFLHSLAFRLAESLLGNSVDTLLYRLEKIFIGIFAEK